ncbi:hypothetical protein BDA99DRAFT_166881 [Phascolomyces articulosus]|uniref:Uncharacterized protein n=1 Tax=Phascolomyces articulosus TaxID=60185 RepID=A0AAD5PB51_9FUNG|nr:hypothetical protein BDA99DRAFT_166881 [Phascolomyces articulosus]
MTANSPVNAGHAYANAAEDYEDREEWAEAAEAHANAAEQFQKAIEFTQDAVTCKTLRLLHLDHLRKAKELQRKLAKIKQQKEDERERQRQQLLQQQQQQQQQAQNAQRPLRQSATSFDMNGLRHALQTSRRLPHPNGGTGAASPAIGGSYAVLPPDGRIEDDEDEDESDPFNKFWEVVETLVDKLSNPVAFASAPLNENDNPTPAWNLQKQEKQDEEEDGVAAKMVESYFFVPEPSQGSVRHDYAAENEQLKKQIEQLVRRVHTLEKTAEESNMLKSSILQFRNDVQKQAKRIMQSHDYSHMRASSSAALMAASTNAAPYSSYLRPSSGDLAARVKELEEENRQLRIQSEKQQALMNKYRERWEKLKESAKKRRAQQPEQLQQQQQQQHHHHHHQDPSATIGSSSPASSTTAGGGANSRMNYTKLASCSSEYVGGSNAGRQPTLLRSLAQQSSSGTNYPPAPFVDPSRHQTSPGKGSPSN